MNLKWAKAIRELVGVPTPTTYIRKANGMIVVDPKCSRSRYLSAKRMAKLWSKGIYADTH